ncbi:MAG: ABC transporter substrate-binding protein [Halobacteriales archaeon]
MTEQLRSEGTGRRELILGSAATAGTAALAGCSGLFGGGGGGDGGDGGDGTTTTGDRPEGGSGDRAVRGSLVSAVGTDAQNMNWLRIADVTSGAFIGTCMDVLYTVREASPEEDGIEPEVFPLWGDIATDEGRVYEIQLRDNLRWSDPYGEMTAEDWVYMIKNVLQGEDNWASFTNRGDWFDQDDNPYPVEKTGSRSFEIRLPKTDPAFPFRATLQAIHCMPKGLLEQYVPDKDGEGLNQDEEVQTLAYTGNLGPYSFERWNRSSEFVALRNDDYYLREADVPERFAGAPYFEDRQYQIIPEESQRLNALKEGEINSASIPPERVQEFQEFQDTYVVISPQAFQKVLIYNMRANGWRPLRRQSVRRALALAVNKQAIVDNIYRGYARPAFTFQPEFSKWYDDSQVVRTGVGDSYGVEMAREALADALGPTEFGYDGDTVVGPEGEPVTLTVIWNTGSPTEKTLTQLIKQEYGKIGLTVEIKEVSGRALQGRYIANRPPEGTDPEFSAGPFNGGPRDVSTSAEPWDLMTALGFNTFPLTPTDTKTFFLRDAQTNFYGYVPEADLQSLFDRATTTDEQQRRDALAELFGVLSEEQPFSYLYMPDGLSGYRTDYVGPEPGFLAGWDGVTFYRKE